MNSSNEDTEAYQEDLAELLTRMLMSNRQRIRRRIQQQLITEIFRDVERRFYERDFYRRINLEIQRQTTAQRQRQLLREIQMYRGILQNNLQVNFSNNIDRSLDTSFSEISSGIQYEDTHDEDEDTSDEDEDENTGGGENQNNSEYSQNFFIDWSSVNNDNNQIEYPINFSQLSRDRQFPENPEENIDLRNEEMNTNFRIPVQNNEIENSVYTFGVPIRMPNIFTDIFSNDFMEEVIIDSFENDGNNIAERNEDQKIKFSTFIYDPKSHDIGEEKSCSICFDDFSKDDEIGLLNCEHFFHSKCIEEWGKYKTECPLCRKDIPEKNNSENTRDSTQTIS